MGYNSIDNIVIIREKESVIVRSIIMRIQELGMNHFVIGETVEEVGMVAENASIFIFYLNNITENTIKTLVYINDLMKEHEQRLIAIGKKEHYDALAKAIPAIRSRVWVDRPLEMSVFDSVLGEVITELHKKKAKKSVLIVDDDPDFAKMIREWIKDKYQVYVVTAGMQAITFLLKKPVDLILLDYEMPVADGPQVLQMLRQDAATANIPVIFLTGLGTKSAVERVMSLKPNGYLLKSTPRAELLSVLEKHLG